jgi:predicted secreted hydrolase
VRGGARSAWLALTLTLAPLVLATPQAAGTDAQVLPPAPGAEFAQASSSRVFEFPRDHGPHPAFRQEWWYVTGNLDAADGTRFGFELTFFRIALAPPAAAGHRAAASDAGASRWRARQLYMAHFAVTDVGAGTFRFAQKLSREALGLAGATGEPLRVWIDDWSLTRDGDVWTLRAAQPGYRIALTLEPRNAPVLNGEGGLSRKSAEAGSASYYYSIPRLAVSGTLTRGDRPLTVSGLAWLDREWGSGGLSAQQAGWDWFALQFSDGAALMFYALRDKDGTRDPYSAGTWIPAAGPPRPLESAQVSIASTASWDSPDGVRYPAAWRLAVPALALDVSVRPVLAAQELTGAPRYWEGAVDVAGSRAGGTVSGRGYVELVGYGGERGAARMTGAPEGLAR